MERRTTHKDGRVTVEVVPDPPAPPPKEKTVEEKILDRLEAIEKKLGL